MLRISLLLALVAAPLFAQTTDLPETELREIRSRIAACELEAVQVAPEICRARTAHGLEAKFDSDGLKLDLLDGAKLGLSPRRLNGRGLEAGDPTCCGASVEINRGALIEWFQNTGSGLMHGFTIPAVPDDSGQLSLELESTLRAEADGERALRLVDDHGAVLSYSGLKAWDAQGRELSARMTADGGSIRIEVNTVGASYPVTIDPLIAPLQQKLIASDAGAFNFFGQSVAVSGDTVVVGAFQNSHSSVLEAGAAYVFVRSGGVWTEQAKLVASDAAANDWFGVSVAIDGNTVLVGAYFDDHTGFSDAGSAYVFVRSGSTWTEQAKLTASDAASSDWFGYSVALDGDTAIVGARLDDHAGGVDAGAAYVFTRSGSVWTQQAKLIAADASADDNFGFAVALSGDTALVGASSDKNAVGSATGSAYVYVRSGGTWTQDQKLLASDGAGGDRFGYSVALGGVTAVIGADSADLPGEVGAGAAYVFMYGSANWYEIQKLTASDAVRGGRFGLSVALSGENAVIGAPYNGSIHGSNAGAAYVYTGISGAWTQKAKLTGTSSSSEEVGWSVAIDGNAVAVASDIDGQAATLAGAVYAFVLDPDVVDDYYVTQRNQAVNLSSTVGLLANDTPAGALRVAGFQNPSAQGGAVNVGADGAFTYTPPSGFFGVDTFTYDVTVDGATVYDTGVVTITVLGVNAPPVITLPAPQNSAINTPLTMSLANGNRVMVTDPDLGLLPMQLSIVAYDGAVALASTTGLTFIAGANGTSMMTVQGMDLLINQALNGMVFTPNTGFAGLTGLQFTANDLGNTGGSAQVVTATLPLLLAGNNAAPQIALPAPQTCAFNGSAALSGGAAVSVADADAGTAAIELAIVAYNGIINLAATTGLTITSGADGTSAVSFEATLGNINNALDGLVFMPNAGFSGLAGIQFTADDLGNTGGAPQTSSALLDVLVNPAPTTSNSPPQIWLPAPQTCAFNASITLSSAGGNALIVSDPDAGTAAIELSIVASDGTVNLGVTSGLTITAGADGSSAITFEGTIAAINNALNGLVFAPTTGYSGLTGVLFTADDLGNTGGAPQTTSGSLAVLVASPTPVSNAPPQITLPPPQTSAFDGTVTLGGANAVIVSDPDAGTAIVEFAISTSEGVITLATTAGLTITAGANGSSAVTVQGTLADINTALDGMTFTPTAGFSGLAGLLFVADDLGNTGGASQTDAAWLTVLVNGKKSKSSDGGDDDDQGCTARGRTGVGLLALLPMLTWMLRRRRTA